MMHRTLTIPALTVLLLGTGLLSGCLVGYDSYEPGVYVPDGVTYVQPTYSAPGPGYYWNYNEGPRAWGWYHHDHGWHGGHGGGGHHGGGRHHR